MTFDVFRLRCRILGHRPAPTRGPRLVCRRCALLISERHGS